MENKPTLVEFFDYPNFRRKDFGPSFFGRVLIRLDELQKLFNKKSAIEHERDEWRAKYKAIAEDTMTVDSKNQVIILSSDSLDKMFLTEEDRNKLLTQARAEAEFYKQKYADEVQKRLDLMKYIDHIEVNVPEGGVPFEKTDSPS